MATKLKLKQIILNYDNGESKILEIEKHNRDFSCEHSPMPIKEEGTYWNGALKKKESDSEYEEWEHCYLWIKIVARIKSIKEVRNV